MSERSVLEERFAAIVEELAGIEGVTVGAGRRGFGSGALQVDGRIFAMARREFVSGISIWPSEKPSPTWRRR